MSTLIYLPWNLQRRFLEGVQVPLGLLAGIGLVQVTSSLGSAKASRMVQATLIAVAAMSNLYLTTGLTQAAAIRNPDLFWSADVINAVDWLGENTSWEETVLTGPATGSLIPARIGHRVVIGHGMETVDWAERKKKVKAFFDVETTDAWRIELLRRHNVSYIFYGSEEQEMGAFDPTSVAYLQVVHTVGDVTIFELTEP